MHIVTSSSCEATTQSLETLRVYILSLHSEQMALDLLYLVEFDFLFHNCYLLSIIFASDLTNEH